MTIGTVFTFKNEVYSSVESTASCPSFSLFRNYVYNFFLPALKKSILICKLLILLILKRL